MTGSSSSIFRMLFAFELPLLNCILYNTLVRCQKGICDVKLFYIFLLGQAENYHDLERAWKKVLVLLNYGQKKLHSSQKSLKKLSVSINNPVSFLQERQNSHFSQKVLETGNPVADGVGKSYKSNINTANSHPIRTLARLRRQCYWEFTSKSILLSATLYPSAPLYWRVYNLGNCHTEWCGSLTSNISCSKTHETTQAVPGSINRKEVMD